MEQNQQEMMFKLQMFEQQIQQIQKQLQAVEQGIVEMGSLNLGLDNLVGAKDKEIFAPIGRGIFAKAKLLSEELSVDIGGGNIVKKSIPETKKIIERQIGKLEDAKENLEKTLNELNSEFMKLIDSAQKKHVHSHDCKGCSDEDCKCDDEGNCGCEK